MEIIKEAFVEGRQTKTPWSDSQAKQNQLKAQIALENFSMMEKREFHSVMPLQQIDPDTGKVLRTFGSRFEAAVWIVENVLKRPDKNPVSITGNIEMCIRSGWKAYGYFWKIIDAKTLMDTSTGGGKKLFGKIGMKVRSFDSIMDVAEYTGISRKVIARRLTKAMGATVEGERVSVYIQPINKDKKTLHFKNAVDAGKALGVPASTAANWIKKGEVVNNYTITANSMSTRKTQYVLYKGRKIEQTFATQVALAASIGVTTDKIYKALKGNGRLPLGYRVVKKG